MKRIVAIILLVATVFSLPMSAFASLGDSDTSIKEFELWAMSPCITGGMTQEDMILQRAIQSNSVNFFPLPELGENYYLAQTVGWFKNSGYSGKTDLGLVRYFLLLMTDSGYIILDNKELYSDYSAVNPMIYNLADKTVKPDKGDRAIYAVYTYYPYTHSSWSSWEECLFITENKKLALKTENNANDYATNNSPYLYDGKIYWGTVKSDYIYLKPMYFENGEVTEGTNVYHAATEITDANGYFKMNNEYEDYQKYGVAAQQYYNMPGDSNKYYTFTLENSPQSTSTSYPTKDLVVSLYEKSNGVPKILRQSRVYTGSSASSLSNIMAINGADENHYKEMGYLVPKVMIQNRYIIGDDGTIGMLKLDSSIFYSSSYYNFGTYKNRLAVIRCRNGSSYIQKTEADGTRVYYQIVNYIYLNSKGEVTLGPDIEIPITNYNLHDTDLNGFYYNTSTFDKPTNIVAHTASRTQEYFGTLKTNYFPDGRYIYGEWVYVGETYEFYYSIFSPEGKLLAFGPTGYIVNSSTSDFEPFIIIESNSKFIVSTDNLTYSKIREFYRVASIKNNDDNETYVGGTMGKKNLNPGVETDTVPVETEIDFSKDDLPIGFNLKDNVVDADKLSSDVREQFNAIRLNDVVIIKDGNSIRDNQNTGTDLESYNQYDTSFGNEGIRIYTNGQKLFWYCTDTSELESGTYDKYYQIGNKIIYIRFKIVDKPDNSGVVTIQF